MPPAPARASGVVQLVILVGSLRAESWNRRLCQLVADEAPSGVSVELLSVGKIPLYDDDLLQTGEPDTVSALRRAVAAADGVLVNTPVYNHGMSGVMKNAIDWLSRPAFAGELLGKPAAVVCATVGRNEPTEAAAQARLATAVCAAVMMDEPDLLVRSIGHRVAEARAVAEAGAVAAGEVAEAAGSGGPWPDSIALPVQDFLARFVEHVGAVRSARPEEES